MTTRIGTVAVVMALAGLMAFPVGWQRVEAAEPGSDAGSPKEPATVPILGTKSFWRYKPVRGTEVVRLDTGELVTVHPDRPKERVGEGKDTRYEWRKEEQAAWDLPVPEGWKEPDFDDSSWALWRGPFSIAPGHKSGESIYRSLPMFCLRGKFAVTDPARVKDLSLSVEYLGGIVVYLNGKELRRNHLPPGKLETFTLAEDYPKEAFVDADGKAPPTKGAFSGGYEGKPLVYNYKARMRELKDFRIPASALRKGVNVLALEIHRAPLGEAYFKGMAGVRGEYGARLHCWSRAGVWTVVLADSGEGVAPNAGHVGRPEGVQIWNQAIEHDVQPDSYGDPNEPLRPITLCGVPNGRFSSQLVVGSPHAIKGLKVTCTELNGEAGTIPASRVQVRYPQFEEVRKGRYQFQALATVPPTEVKVAEGKGAVQPVWFTVDVPRKTSRGRYTGKAAITAEGFVGVELPIELDVIDWALPDAREFVTGIGMFQSPDSVALKYKVTMWSERHWELIERSFKLMGDIGCKEVFLTAVRRTHIGNEHSLIQYKREDGPSAGLPATSLGAGRLVPDLSIAEKYLGLAAKHLGRPLVVCLYCWEHTGTGH